MELRQVLRAMRSAPELGDCVRAQVFESKCDVSRTLVARAVARGELPAGTDPLLLHEVAGALWFHRVLVVGGPVDDAFVCHVVDDVLIPLLTAGAHPPGRADLTDSPETPESQLEKL